MLSPAFYFMYYRGKCVAFDGLSLAGKSTMVQMLYERCVGAEVVRENRLDPHRNATSRANKLLNGKLTQEEWALLDPKVRTTNAAPIDPELAAYQASMEFPASRQILKGAAAYSSRFPGEARSQVFLAYMFTAGRREVDSHVREALKKGDVILDRWKLTGCAYQAAPPHYSWEDVMALNEDFGVLTPDLQFIMTVPIDQIDPRRAFRAKEGAGTAGQMSRGREQTILAQFKEMAADLSAPWSIYVLENQGVPAEGIKQQVEQAVPTYHVVEGLSRAFGVRVKGNLAGATAGWDDPQVLERIKERQK